MKKLAGNILLTIGALTSIGTATIIHVPQDQPTIQTEIDAAIEGDIALVDTEEYQLHWGKHCDMSLDSYN